MTLNLKSLLLQAEHMVEMLSREVRTKQADLDRAEGNRPAVYLYIMVYMQFACNIHNRLEATLVTMFFLKPQFVF